MQMAEAPPEFVAFAVNHVYGVVMDGWPDVVGHLGPGAPPLGPEPLWNQNRMLPSASMSSACLYVWSFESAPHMPKPTAQCECGCGWRRRRVRQGK